MRPICWRNSSGGVVRWALYSGRIASRSSGAPRSKATARYRLLDSCHALISMEVNPYTALVACPLVVRRSASARAKKAR